MHRLVGLIDYLARRLGVAVAILWGTATLTFLAMRVVPGDPIDMIVNTDSVRPEVVDQIRADLGLDEPVPVQYWHYLAALLHGDLGRSYQLRRPVTQLLLQNIGPTVALAGSAALLTIVLAVALAVATAGRRGPLRAVISTVELTTVAMPAFFTGLILLFVFSFRLGWFPVASREGLRGLVLPAFTLALGHVGVMAQVLRDGLEEALRQPFVLTARSRGLGRLAVTARHALRHAFAPVLTMAGTLLGTLVGGAVIVENVFGRAGLGRVTLQAVTTRDMPVVMGVVLLSAVAFTAVSITVDALNRLIDPRLRTRRRVRAGTDPEATGPDPTEAETTAPAAVTA